MPVQIFRLFEGLMIAMDDNLQFAKNLRLWLMFEPLFGDYGWRGRLVGFFMRGMRALVTIVIYALVFVTVIVFMLGWIALLPLSITMILQLI